MIPAILVFAIASALGLPHPVACAAFVAACLIVTNIVGRSGWEDMERRERAYRRAKARTLYGLLGFGAMIGAWLFSRAGRPKKA